MIVLSVCVWMVVVEFEILQVQKTNYLKEVVTNYGYA